MEEYQWRVIDERNQLATKLNNLNGFIDTSQMFKNLGKVDQNLLVEQRFHMKDYFDILNLRIERFSAATN